MTYWCPRRGWFSSDTALLADASGVEYFIIDCGCTKHSVPNVSDLDTITDDHPHQSIIVASKQHMPVAAIGTKTNVVTAYPADSNHEGPGHQVEMKLTNVWAVPGLAASLLLQMGLRARWHPHHDQRPEVPRPPQR